MQTGPSTQNKTVLTDISLSSVVQSIASLTSSLRDQLVKCFLAL